MALPLFIWRDGGTLRARVGSEVYAQGAGAMSATSGDDVGFLLACIDLAIDFGLEIGVIRAGLRRLGLSARAAAAVEKYLATQWRKHKKGRKRKGTRPSPKRGGPGSRRSRGNYKRRRR